MILKQINIINFGQLSNLTFDLPSNNLNLFFGQNEAGKSTTVAFIKQVLFGFYLRSNSSPFFEDYKPLGHVSPMGGSLIFESDDGAKYKLERLWAKGDKTKRGILTVTKDGQKVPESLFYDQIKEIDGDFYADSFIFNQDMLTQVAKLNQEDLLERIYYLGAANSNQLLALRDEFDKKANSLFKKTGKKPEVNQLLKQLEEKRSTLTEVNLEFQEYQKLSQELHEKEKNLVQTQKNIKELEEKLAKVNKAEEQLKIYRQIQELVAKEKNIKFDPENYQHAQEIFAQAQNLQVSLKRINQKLSDLTEIKEVDSSKIMALTHKKSELLQWQSNLQMNLQTKKQIQLEQQELLQMNPELKAINDLSDLEFNAIKEEIKNLSQKAEPVETNSNDKIFFVISAIIMIFAVIEIFNNVFIGGLGIVVGLAILIWTYFNSNKIKQEQELALKKKQEKISDFKTKYQLDPNEIDFRNLALARNSYLLDQKKLVSVNEEIKQIIFDFQNLAQEITAVTASECLPEYQVILTKLNSLEEKMHLYQRRQEKLDDLKKEKQSFEQKAKELELKLKADLAKDNINEISEYERRYQEYLEQAKLKVQIKALKDSLSIDYAKLEKLKMPQLEQDKTVIQSENEQKNNELDIQQQAIAQLRVKMKNMADSTQVFEAKQELANTETKFINASKEYLSLLLAEKWISRSLDIASNERFPKMLKSACNYFNLLTGGRYVDLKLDKKLTVVRKDGRKREVRYLSRATAEQLYFALKLAFVEQIKDQINLPILIDDSFVNFDEQRIGYIEELLNKIGQNNQVLIFTAQEKLSDSLRIKPLTFRKDTANA